MYNRIYTWLFTDQKAFLKIKIDYSAVCGAFCLLAIWGQCTTLDTNGFTTVIHELNTNFQVTTSTLDIVFHDFAAHVKSSGIGTFCRYGAKHDMVVGITAGFALEGFGLGNVHASSENHTYHVEVPDPMIVDVDIRSDQDVSYFFFACQGDMDALRQVAEYHVCRHAVTRALERGILIHARRTFTDHLERFIRQANPATQRVMLQFLHRFDASEMMDDSCADRLPTSWQCYDEGCVPSDR